MAINRKLSEANKLSLTETGVTTDAQVLGPVLDGDTGFLVS